MKNSKFIKEKLSSLLSMWLLIMSVAIWSVYIQDGYINRDGLLYLKQAYLIAEGEYSEGLALYPWSFFSILIAIFNKIFSLNLQLVAHGVCLTLFGAACFFYLKTLILIHKEKQIIFFGGIILLSFIPIMDDYVGMILRDHGLWAGCMMGTYFYFKNSKEYFLKNSIFWQFGFFFAGLFRPEGLALLVLLPLWNLFQNKSHKIKKLFYDYLLLILLFGLALIGVLFFNIDLISFVNSSRLSEFLNRPVQFLEHLIKPIPLNSNNEYLSTLLKDYSLVISYTVLLSILFFKWIKGLGLFHGGLFLYSFLKKDTYKNFYSKDIYFFLVLSFIIVSINLFNVYVLSNRYWGFHWFWLFILITPILMNFFKKNKNNLILKWIAVFFIIVLSFNSLVDKDRNIEKEVAKYIQLNHLNNINYNDNDRINYYVYKDISILLHKLNKDNFQFDLLKTTNNIELSSYKVIKNFPEINPKYSLIENVK